MTRPTNDPWSEYQPGAAQPAEPQVPQGEQQGLPPGGVPVWPGQGGPGYGGPPPGGPGYGGPPPGGPGYGYQPPGGPGYGGPPPGYGGPPPGGPGYGYPPPGGMGYGGPPGPPPYGAFPPSAVFGSPVRPAPTGPSPALGILKIVAGFFLGVFILVAYLQQSHAGYGTAFALALMLGMAVRGVVVGAANVAKKRMALLPSFGVTLAVGFVGALAGPTLSEVFCKSDERSQWEEVTGLESGTSFRAETWKTEYEDRVDAKWRRPDWKGHWMLARVKDAVRDKRQSDLRVILKEIAAESPASQAIFTPARDEATKAFRDYYDQAKAKMFTAPSAAGAGAAKEREFAVDDGLRRAFVELFEDLARSPDANVYVAFANSVKLDAPKGTELELAFMRRQPDALAKFPKGDAPVILQGDAFSPAFDTRRRQTFMTALSESFGQVFDADLLTLVPLEAGADRKGKIVFEVSSAIARTNDFYVYTHTDEATAQKLFVGFLFGIYVDWDFTIFDRAGKALYDPKPTRSLPADNMRVQSGDNDPQWAMYSVMMDSAYYNYSRVITGKFGLTPPAIRESFSYEGGK